MKSVVGESRDIYDDMHFLALLSERSAICSHELFLILVLHINYEKLIARYFTNSD